MKKSRIRRMLALMTALGLLTGCTAPGTAKPEEPAQSAAGLIQELNTEALTAAEAKPAAQEMPDAAQTLAGGGYFPRYPREEAPFREMTCPAMTEADFLALCDACKAAAETGSQAEFHRAWDAVTDGLYTLNTAMTLRDLESCAKAGDEALARQAAESEDLAYRSSDLFLAAMQEISQGAGKELLRREAPDWLMQQIVSYDAETSEESLRLTEEEIRLEKEYEALSAEDDWDEQAMGEVFVELVKLRRQMAELEGMNSFADYAYMYYYDREYTPEETQRLWNTAKADFAPLMWRYLGPVQQTLSKLDQDSIDCSEQAVLQALKDGAAAISPEVWDACRYMTENGLYDAAYSEDKLYISYTTWICDWDAPFIFSCAEDFYTDYQTLFHEFGHFLSMYYNGSDPVFGVSDLDLSELQSQGMEILFLERYDEIFGEELAEPLRAEKLLDLVYSVVTGAMMDEFQQRVYAEKDLTVGKVNQIYRELRTEYGFEEFDGCEWGWLNVLHNFEYPFYYISYAMSAFPALELFLRQQESPADAADTYLRAAAMSDETCYLSDAVRENGFLNILNVDCGDILAGALEDSGVFDRWKEN